jgi:hypothetical protein
MVSIEKRNPEKRKEGMKVKTIASRMATTWLRVVVEIRSPIPTVHMTYMNDNRSRSGTLPLIGALNQKLPRIKRRTISKNAIAA